MPDSNQSNRNNSFSRLSTWAKPKAQKPSAGLNPPIQKEREIRGLAGGCQVDRPRREIRKRWKRYCEFPPFRRLMFNRLLQQVAEPHSRFNGGPSERWPHRLADSLRCRAATSDMSESEHRTSLRRLGRAVLLNPKTRQHLSRAIAEGLLFIFSIILAREVRPNNIQTMMYGARTGKLKTWVSNINVGRIAKNRKEER